MTTNTFTLTLDTPIQRGEQSITEITLRKPTAGELRGLNLVSLISIDVGAIIEILPRITTPFLSKADAAALDPADLMQLGTVVAGFLVPKQREQSHQDAENA